MSETLDLLRLLEITAYNLMSATLVGNQAPKVKALYDRMRAPQVGDLVLEQTTIWYEDRNGTRLGWLRRIAEEPVYSAEEWAENDGGDAPIPTERIWYIELPNGREFGWRNASFMAIPPRIDAFRHFAFDDAPARSLATEEAP